MEEVNNFSRKIMNNKKKTAITISILALIAILIAFLFSYEQKQKETQNAKPAITQTAGTKTESPTQTTNPTPTSVASQGNSSEATNTPEPTITSEAGKITGADITIAPTKEATTPTPSLTHGPTKATDSTEITITPTSVPTPVTTKAPTTTPTKKPTVTPTKKPTSTPTATPASSNVTITKYSFSQQSVPSNSAINFVNGMTVGWNLGNTFDATGCTWLSNKLDYEWGWLGNAKYKTTTKLIDAVYNAGFNTIRIPVSWHDHVDSNYNIDSAWLARVTEIVDYCYDKGMYVIINIHHDVDTNYYYPSSAKLSQSTKYMEAIWTQLAKNFSGYGEKLIFEAINEPRLTGHNNEWWWTSSSADCVDALNCIMELNQVFVDTVRATGGNNATRYLMIPSYDSSYGPITMNNFSLPTDTASNKLIVTAHAYLSYNFAQNTSGTNSFDNTSKNENLECMKQLYNRYVKNGIPVVIGEFGVIDKNNEQDLANYCSYVIGCAKSYGIRCAIWDNNAFLSSGSTDYNNKFGIIDRATCEIKQPNMVKAMMQYF